jgi:hypothetical protein
MNKQNNTDYLYTDNEWNKSIGWGKLPPEHDLEKVKEEKTEELYTS